MRTRRVLLALVLGVLAGAFGALFPFADSPLELPSSALAAPAQAPPGGPEWMPLKGRYGNAIGCTWSNGCVDPAAGYHVTPAIDFMVPSGAGVYAAGPGIVEVAYRGCAINSNCGPANSGLGNSIAIKHDNGRYSWYGHMTEVYPAEGQRVATGEQIGTVGSTGVSTGPHLHYEERATRFGARILPGSMLAFHGDRKVSYPEILGKKAWNEVPCGRQRTEPGCNANHTVRNDGYTAQEATTPKTGCTPKRLGVVFVLDDSGSNSETDPRLLRADATRVALGYLPSGTIVSAVKFGSFATTVLEPTPLTNANREPIALRVRQSLATSGATNYEAAFRQALELLNRTGAPQKIVVFLSDGKPTSPYSTDQRIAGLRIQIHTVGYGPVRNLPVLIDIARRSGASYQPIDNVAEASNAFAAIINPYQCNRAIGDENGRAGRNRTFRAHFVVRKGLRGITAIASWTWQSTPSLELVRPDGTRLIPGRRLYQGEAIRKQGLQVVRFDVTKPYPGRWTLIARSRKSVNLAFNVWSTNQTPVAFRPYKYVALGDSYSSGEGVSPYFGDSPCHRSSRAYATRVQPRVYDKPLYEIASGDGDPGRFRGLNKYGSDENVRTAGGVTWALLACSGAVADGVRGQMRRSLIDKDVDLVTLTAGGNDTGFAEALEYCFFQDCTVSWFESNYQSIIRGTVKRKLIETYRAVGAAMPNARVLVLGYPQIFPRRSREQNCWGLRQFRGEQDMLRRLGVVLNATIESAVREVRPDAPRIEFVPVVGRFEGHEVCGEEGGWILGLAKGAFHPNELGQRLGYAAAINERLESGGP